MEDENLITETASSVPAIPEETEEIYHIKISVRNLVEFVLQSGDIDDRIGGVNQANAMQEGSRIHRKLQKKGGSMYHAEVPLKHVISYGEFDLGIEGRADGIIYDVLEMDEKAKRKTPKVTIDEIKGMYADVASFEHPIEVHLAQAKTYAYIFSLQNQLPEIKVQMTYVNLDTEEMKRFKETYQFEELEQWFEQILSAYEKWARFEYEWMKTRNASIHSLQFPYEYRPGQKAVASMVYRSIDKGDTLFVQAPTGTGKTLSTLFPAIKAVGEDKAQKIFYLTAKTIARTVARDTITLLGERGYRGKTVEITAKDTICHLEERACNPDDCPYAKGHFDRVADAVYELLQTKDMYDRETVIEQSKKCMVCPFELSLDLASHCDNILCDYNYVFDPNAALQRFFAEGRKGDYIFLVDEAHNMVDRAREMYSAVLYKEDFLTLKNLLKDRAPKASKAANKCNRILLTWKKELEADILYPEDIDPFVFALLQLANKMDLFLEKRIAIPEQNELMEIYFRIRYFLTITEWLDQRYVIYCDMDREGRFGIHLYCVDPSHLLGERIKMGRACVYFSATLLPIQYYKELLTSKEDPPAIYADSVFREDQRKLLIGTDVTTRYKARSNDMYERYAKYVAEIISQRKGNYMIFCPSYAFMQQVYDCFIKIVPSYVDVIMQESGMREADRAAFLSEFDPNRKNMLAAFCVMGGIFGEGIDLTEDALIGAVIIGTGLPQVGTQTKLLQEHFSKQGKDGFLYAYLYPGMNKVQQSAGRVIRTEQDKGVIALLDDRFMQRQYQSCFPREWSSFDMCTLETVGMAIDEFWNAADNA